MIERITEETINEFNQIMENEGSTVRLTMSKYRTFSQTYEIFVKDKYIVNSAINLSDEFCRKLVDFFKEKEIYIDSDSNGRLFWQK